MKRTVLVVLVAALVVLAGCSGASPGGQSGDGTTPGTDGGAGDGSTTSDGDTGTVRFYVSDQQMAIDDFRHLNVTITGITFHKADDGADGGESDEEDESGDGNETETNETAEPTATPTNATATNETNESDAGEGADDGGSGDGDDGADGGDGESDGESGSKIQVDVDSRTVDLTELKGENATLVEEYDLPSGKYTKVFLHVGAVEGILKDGTQVNVKLPSEKLHLNKGFTLEPNKTVSFVYDVSVVKAGKSGKYILKPVISESGPDQEIREVGDDGDEDEKAEDEAEGESEADEAENETETNETSTGDAGSPTPTATS